jgi:hypothetical protein
MANVTSTSLFDTLLMNASTTVSWTSENASGIDTMIIEPLSIVGKHAKHNFHPHNVSAVLLSTEWPRLTRILFLTIMSAIGSVGNIFMISSVMIEDQLKKAGKHFGALIFQYFTIYFLYPHFECKLDFVKNKSFFLFP